MNKLGIVIKEVYRKNVLSWSFFWMVASPILVLAIAGAVMFFIVKDQMASSAGHLALINTNPEITEVIKASNHGNEIEYDWTLDQAQEALDANEIDGYLVIDESNPGAKYYRKTTSKDIRLDSFQVALTNLALKQTAQDLGLSDQDLQSVLNTNVAIEEINVSRDDRGEQTEQSSKDPKVFAKTAVAYIASIAVFMFIMSYISIISQEIAAEKGSRIMEIILSSVTATQHFLGKIFGIFLVILTQIFVYIVIYFIAKFVVDQFNLLGRFEFIRVLLADIQIGQLLSSISNVIFLSLIYAVLGILMYSSLAGFFGSLVSKTEDVNKSVTPISFVGLAGFYIGMYALNSPNSSIVRIGSQIPLFTPFVMPFRIASDTVNHEELILSIVLNILATVLIVIFSLMFYKSNVLVYSDKGILNALKRSFALWRSERKS